MRRSGSEEPRQGVVEHRQVGSVRLVHATVGIRARAKKRGTGSSLRAARWRRGCAIAGRSGPAVPRIGAKMAGIAVRKLSDWCPIAVRFHQEARPAARGCHAHGLEGPGDVPVRRGISV